MSTTRGTDPHQNVRRIGVDAESTGPTVRQRVARHHRTGRSRRERAERVSSSGTLAATNWRWAPCRPNTCPLHVPDLQHAEEYYQHVFDLDVVTREALTNGSITNDERWAQLPHTAT